MSIVKQIMAIILLSASGVVFGDHNSNTNVNHNYPSRVDHSGTVVHRYRLATSSEKILAEARAAAELEDFSKPYIQRLCEPIGANIDYCLNANPLGVSNSAILGTAAALYAICYVYKTYIAQPASQEPKE